MSLLRRLWREQRLVLVAFLVASALALFFGGRIVVRGIYWANPAHHRQLPEAWMTPGYIARSWHLPPEAVDAAIGVEDSRNLFENGPPTLERIAAQQHVSATDLIGRLEAVLPEIAAQDRPAP